MDFTSSQILGNVGPDTSSAGSYIVEHTNAKEVPRVMTENELNIILRGADSLDRLNKDLISAGALIPSSSNRKPYNSAGVIININNLETKLKEGTVKTREDLKSLVKKYLPALLQQKVYELFLPLLKGDK